ncbi:unnamed protein product, partial [Porites lobata]
MGGNELFKVKTEEGKQYMYLTRYVDWQFLNLNALFNTHVGTIKQTVMLYCDVVESTIVGTQKHSLLRKVELERRGQGRATVEPLHREWIRLRSKRVEIIEVSLATPRGSLLVLPTGKTLVTLGHHSVNMSLNLFDVPDIDYRYEAKRWIPFKPANTGRRPILFTVPSSEHYYDLNETKLEVKVRMNTTGTGGLDDDETAASDGNDTKYVYCANNFGHTLFNQMNVSFNGVLMTEQSNAYHHKAYVETMLNYSREEGKTTLAAQGWVNELNVRASLTPTNAGTNDKPNPSDWDGKTGLKSLTRQLYLNDSSLFLFGTPDTTTSVGKKIPTLEDNDIFVTLWMKKVTLNASVYTRLQKERSLSKTKKVQYPVVRSEIRTYSFDGNSTRWEQDNVFVNKIPGKVIIGLMNSTNYHGSLQHYPFAYQKFGVTRVRQTIDGEEYPYRS